MITPAFPVPAKIGYNNPTPWKAYSRAEQDPFDRSHTARLLDCNGLSLPEFPPVWDRPKGFCMNYQKHYDLLIERARNRVVDGYVERHHIIPRCMGGSNEPHNLVVLTAEEHFVAHQLLVKMYPNDGKLAHAAMLMTCIQNGKRNNNKKFGWLRKANAKAAAACHAGKQHTLGHKLSDKHKAKIAAAGVGRKMSDKNRKALLVAHTGRKASIETKAKQRAAKLGNSNAAGRVISDEYREKVRKSLLKYNAARRAQNANA